MQSKWLAYRKTFLSGEYAACEFGRGLIITYGPPFSMSESDKTNLSTFGKSVVKQFPKIQSNLDLTDPKVSHGGVGASSAELACIYQYLCDSKLQQDGNLLQKRQWYRKYTWDGVGLPPSGIDFIAQKHLGLMWVDCESSVCEKIKWPFRDFSWLVLTTNEKLNTYTHLKKINHSEHFKILNALLDPIKNALDTKNFYGFIQALERYDENLKTLGLTTESHTPYLNAIRKLSDVKYIRGCGAMGKDTWLILTKKSKQSHILKTINEIFSISNYYSVDLNTYDTN